MDMVRNALIASVLTFQERDHEAMLLLAECKTRLEEMQRELQVFGIVTVVDEKQTEVCLLDDESQRITGIYWGRTLEGDGWKIGGEEFYHLFQLDDQLMKWVKEHFSYSPRADTGQKIIALTAHLMQLNLLHANGRSMVRGIIPEAGRMRARKEPGRATPFNECHPLLDMKGVFHSLVREYFLKMARVAIHQV